MFINVKQFKKDMLTVLKANKYSCRVFFSVNSGVNMVVDKATIKVMWCRHEFILHVGRARYVVPYKNITTYSLHDVGGDTKGIVISLIDDYLLIRNWR